MKPFQNAPSRFKCLCVLRNSGNGKGFKSSSSGSVVHANCKSSPRLLVCWVCGSSTRTGVSAVLVVLAAAPGPFNCSTLVCTHKTHKKHTHIQNEPRKNKTLMKQNKIVINKKQKQISPEAFLSHLSSGWTFFPTPQSSACVCLFHRKRWYHLHENI